MALDVTRGATAGAAQYPILKLNEAKAITAISKSAAFTCELTGGDYKTVFIMTPAANGTVAFSVGNGIQGVGATLTVTVAKDVPSAIVLDSGYFKNVSGTAKDGITITPSGSTSFLICELPQ